MDNNELIQRIRTAQAHLVTEGYGDVADELNAVADEFRLRALTPDEEGEWQYGFTNATDEVHIVDRQTWDWLREGREDDPTFFRRTPEVPAGPWVPVTTEREKP